ncbi:hypothetical protein L6R49_15860 [Myxococcota bacterium]|nr:hypothetical protein [Myxococcota bacterium]
MALPKSVTRVVRVRVGERGVEVESLFERSTKKRKTSRAFRRAEKLQRRWLQAQRTFADQLLARHERSASKRRDGWLRDGQINIVKSSRKAWKRLTRM